jgi:hypothetical protein
MAPFHGTQVALIFSTGGYVVVKHKLPGSLLRHNIENTQYVNPIPYH